MNQEPLLPVLGRCPLCDQPISSEQLLATYTAAGEWPRILAECRNCDVIVGPV